MDLILWRHADASDTVEGTPDHDRPLTDKGRAQAKRMAQWLNKHLPDDATILVSPAVRAQQTAQALKRAFVTINALDTGADCNSALKAVGAPKAGKTALLVGHQPTLGQIASLLLTGEASDMSVKKGAVWWITVRSERKRPAVLRAAITPELL